MNVGVMMVAILGCALMGGVFFTFSTFVMPALARLPPAQGITAMQAINVTAVRAPLMLALFGTAAACAFLSVRSLVAWHDPGSPWRLAGASLYLVGGVLVTILCNVPRNDALAAAAPDTHAGANLWARYLVSWTAWNHVRTAAALGAAVLLMLAL